VLTGGGGGGQNNLNKKQTSVEGEEENIKIRDRNMRTNKQGNRTERMKIIEK
jgi:hypothetical protein